LASPRNLKIKERLTEGPVRAFKPLELKMATKHPQRRRKTGADREKRLSNPDGRKIITKPAKIQIIRTMNIKSNGKSRLRTDAAVILEKTTLKR
jgi:hypothetical protein